MGRVVVLGSINADVIACVPAFPAPEATILGTSVQVRPGGKGLNQAVAAARDGADVVLAGCVGADQWGDEVLAFLRTTSVDHSLVRRALAVVSRALETARIRGSTTVLNPSPVADIAPGGPQGGLASATVVVVNQNEVAALDLPRTRVRVSS